MLNTGSGNGNLTGCVVLSHLWRFLTWPLGMWVGLIAGLTVAAALLGLRFLRISRRVAIVTP